MATITQSCDAVARVAYLASDNIVSVVPGLGKDSEFSHHLQSYTSGKSTVKREHAPEIESVRANTDPLLSVYKPVRAGNRVAVTANASILIQSVPHLYKLAHYPVVLHISLKSAESADYSQISAVRQCGFIFLHSESLAEAQDLAITAHALAQRTGKGVIHFFDPDKLAEDKAIPQEDRALVEELLSKSQAQTNGHATDNDTSIYADTDRVPNGSHGGLSNGTSSGSEQLSRTTSATSAEAPTPPEDIHREVKEIWAEIEKSTGRKYRPFEYTGPADAKAAVFAFGADVALLGAEMDQAKESDIYHNCGLITVRLYRPWLGNILSDYIPKSLNRIAILEQIKRKTTKWGPVLLDFLTSLNTGSVPDSSTLIVGYQLGHLEPSTIRQALNGIFSNLLSQTPIQNLEIGSPIDPKSTRQPTPEQPELENAYMKILDQLFGNKLYVANRLGETNAGVSSQMAVNPEFGFGALLAHTDRRKRFISEVQQASTSNDFITKAPQKWLAKWTVEAETDQANVAADDALMRLRNDGSPTANKLLESQSLFFKQSPWLIGSDAWAYDLGNSGVHHVLASGQNVNMLIVDSQPYSEHTAADATRRKKDIGLYAMNFGNAYVASTAVYSSYTQVLEAMIEADKFNGPSVVLAYLPYNKEGDNALVALQETKKAVDLGYWPLYRWHPATDHRLEPEFQLDSERLKKELEEFLRRDNKLTQVMKRHPEFSANLAGSYGSEVRDLQKRKAKDAFGKLLEGLMGAPVTILFASDNSNAENLAKRLGNRGKARGLKTIVYAMDDYPIEDLALEENIVLITSTAGQGEFPQNGRNFWETVKNSTDLDLGNVNFSVFGLGDSHYWPRKEDKLYYNKPSKDLFARIATLGGKQLADIGLGDDQDPDGYQTGYNEWEPKLWQSLGVANVEGLPEEPPPLTNEDIKIQSNYLRGTIAEGLKDTSTGSISASDQQLTKFHGTYQQDDRDLRDERKAQGLEPAYSFMIRCRLPGGVATPAQWLQMDDISTNLGNETMKLTTRQTFQFHGVVKGKLRPAMQAINKALMTTIAACGDINRNVMCSSLPQKSAYHAEVHAVSKRISDHLLPSTNAYHEVWLQEEGEKKVQVAGDAIVDQEPLYGPTYLPRKFKISIAIPPHNDTDVYAHDVGLIAIKDSSTGALSGFNIIAGGGMGVTHNMKKTYPRTGSMFGYVSADQAPVVCEKIMIVQRDHGDRKNRKHARLKYTMDDMGVDVFRGKVEELLGWKFAEAKPFQFDSNIDTFGWQTDERGNNHFTMFIENGRVEDTADFRMKAGLRELAQLLKDKERGEFRLTANQHLIVSDVAPDDLAAVKDVLHKYKLDNTAFSALRLSSSACVAFPTCGMAMAESERYLPEFITKLETTIEEAGLRQESIVLRMTGCPNGCARPWLAEIALVGKSFGFYNLYLGGGYHGDRLNKLYRSSIGEEEILEILRPMVKRFAVEKETGEKFGDWVIRAGIINRTTEGKFFHEDTAEVEEDDE